ncbi:conserved domain protein [delta proteobacterium NaphS2]|nr:conserved domain protein [delta proteobacterium NaphS2]
MTNTKKEMLAAYEAVKRLLKTREKEPPVRHGKRNRRIYKMMPQNIALKASGTHKKGYTVDISHKSFIIK